MAANQRDRGLVRVQNPSVDGASGGTPEEDRYERSQTAPIEDGDFTVMAQSGFQSAALHFGD